MAAVVNRILRRHSVLKRRKEPSSPVTILATLVLIIGVIGVESVPAGTNRRVIFKDEVVTSPNDVNLKIRVLKYLQQFGYIDSQVAFTVNNGTNAGFGFPTRTASIVVKSSLGEDDNELDVTSDETLAAALKKFQKNFGLQVTGKLDEKVLKEMDQPRCGVKDVVDEGVDGNSGGYTYLGGRPRAWKKRHLTYRIDVYSRKLPEHLVDREIRRAFNAWSEVTDLTFEQVPTGSRADIEIRFGAFAHSDYNWDPWFDGPGGTLAHAFGPDNGDAHFDESEPWGITDEFDGTRNGVDLFQVAVHEFGHSLGLGHSRDRRAIMFATYRRNNQRLMPDDIRGIQSLYGLKTKRETPSLKPDISGRDTTTSTPSFTTSRPLRNKPAVTTRRKPSVATDEPSMMPDLCANSTFDAIVTASDGGLYVFKGNYYWSMMDVPTSNSRRRRRRHHLPSPPMVGPRLISQDWDGMTGPVDAAFTHVSVSFGIPFAATFFFKGDKCWRFTADGGLTRGYPKAISRVFSGIPSDIDAALQHGPRGSIYFFKGDQYWKFDPISPTPVDTSIYPRSIAEYWNGLEGRVKAAFQLNSGRSFFFEDDRYYEYDVPTNQVLPGYPGSVRADWFGCSSR